MLCLTRHTSLRCSALAALAAGAVTLTAGLANAGECPTHHRKAVTNGSAPMKPEGVTDIVLAAINLASDTNVQVPGRSFRIRRLVVQPGGIVPFHSHEDRPALIYVVQGTIIEHASTCAVPIVHRAGDVSRETKDVAHWWKNESKQPVILISTDLLHEKADSHVM